MSIAEAEQVCPQSMAGVSLGQRGAGLYVGNVLTVS